MAETATTSAIERLHAELDGAVITPEDGRYEVARKVFYGNDPPNVFRLNQNLPVA
jgi:hypothetical protein